MDTPQQLFEQVNVCKMFVYSNVRRHKNGNCNFGSHICSVSFDVT